MKTNKEVILNDMYESPRMDVVEIQTEGVLCMSGTGTYEDLTEEDFEW